ncbi:MAG: DUF4406 domain-containing protein [Clostridia bacterium]
MKKIYICSPLKGLDGNYKKNTMYAREIAKQVFENGDLPIVPHLFFPLIMNDTNPAEREKAIKMGLELLKMADCVHVYCRYGVSSGMKKEIDLAIELGIPVKYMA